MSVSVVIPLYNKGPHIERALHSVLSQTAPPREIIVVDDGSTDRGGKVVQSFPDPRIRLIRQENQGVSAARNRGITEAQGEVIAFLDADDEWRPNYLAIIQNLRQRYPEAGLYATAYAVVSPEGKRQSRHFLLFPHHRRHGLITDYFRVALCFPVWTSAAAVPRRVLDEVGGFRVSEVQGEDVDLWLRIALRYPMAWSREPAAVYHKDATNRSVGFHRWSGEPLISRTGRQALADGLVPEEHRQDLREYLAHFQVNAARDCLVRGKRDLARQLLEHARGTRKFATKWWFYRLLAVLPEDAGPRLWRLKQVLKQAWT